MCIRDSLGVRRGGRRYRSGYMLTGHAQRVDRRPWIGTAIDDRCPGETPESDQDELPATGRGAACGDELGAARERREGLGPSGAAQEVLQAIPHHGRLLVCLLYTSPSPRDGLLS